MDDVLEEELDELGVSLGKANYCIKALVDNRWVKMQNFGISKNKLGYVYQLTPKGITQKTSLTARFLKLKMREYEHLKAEIRVLKKELNSE